MRTVLYLAAVGVCAILAASCELPSDDEVSAGLPEKKLNYNLVCMDKAGAVNVFTGHESAPRQTGNVNHYGTWVGQLPDGQVAFYMQERGEVCYVEEIEVERNTKPSINSQSA